MKPKHLIRILGQHLAAWVEARRFADATLQTYRQALHRFTAWLETASPQGDLGTEFRNYLLDEEKLSPKTANTYLGGLQSYFKFLTARRLVDTNPFVGVSARAARREARRTLAVEECRALLRALEAGREPLELRNAAIVRLMLTTGLRVGSIVAADVEDLEAEGDTPRLRVKHKGRVGKDDFVVLGSGTAKAIQRYVRCTGQASGPLFLPHAGRTGIPQAGKRLRRTSLWKSLHDCFARAGMGDDLSPHSLRRTAITLARGRGAELEDLRAMAGHASVATTELYDQGVRRVQRAPELELDRLLSKGTRRP